MSSSSSSTKKAHTPKKPMKSTKKLKKNSKPTSKSSSSSSSSNDDVIIIIRAHTVRAHVRKLSTIKKKRMLTKPIAASIKKVNKQLKKKAQSSNDDDDDDDDSTNKTSEWIEEDLEMAMALSMELHQKQATQKALRAKLMSIEDALSSSNTQPTLKQQAIMASLSAEYKASINAASIPLSSSKTIKQEPQTCCICITAIGTLIPARKLKCKHTFHHHCIEQWINTNPSCPECRCPID